MRSVDQGSAQSPPALPSRAERANEDRLTHPQPLVLALPAGHSRRIAVDHAVSDRLLHHPDQHGEAVLDGRPAALISDPAVHGPIHRTVRDHPTGRWPRPAQRACASRPGTDRASWLQASQSETHHALAVLRERHGRPSRIDPAGNGAPQELHPSPSLVLRGERLGRGGPTGACSAPPNAPVPGKARHDRAGTRYPKRPRHRRLPDRGWCSCSCSRIDSQTGQPPLHIGRAVHRDLIRHPHEWRTLSRPARPPTAQRRWVDPDQTRELLSSSATRHTAFQVGAEKQTAFP